MTTVANADSPPGSVTNTQRVLLMLDMQRCMLEPEPVGVPASKAVSENLEQVLAYARASPHPPLIIHVRNMGDPGESDETDTPGWQLIFPPLPNELVIDKRKNNAFAGTGLGAAVSTDAEIVVVGFQTDFSVRATCSAALGRGNEVILLKEAHATFDRIEVLHGGGVTAAAVIEAEIEAELEEAGVHIFEMKDLPGIFADR